MINNLNQLGEFVSTIHNPECVVEVYFDRAKNEVNEVKCLNYNRYKVYNYKFENYSEHIKKYNLVFPEVN